MKKTDWVSKLSSRKFWALLAALATSILTAGGAADNTVVQVTGIIAAVGACVAYMLAEGIADASGGKNNDKTEQERNDIE